MPRRHVFGNHRKFGWCTAIGRNNWRDHYFQNRWVSSLCGIAWCRNDASLSHKPMYACKTCERLHKKRVETQKAKEKR